MLSTSMQQSYLSNALLLIVARRMLGLRSAKRGSREAVAGPSTDDMTFTVSRAALNVFQTASACTSTNRVVFRKVCLQRRAPKIIEHIEVRYFGRTLGGILCVCVICEYLRIQSTSRLRLNINA